MVEQTRWGISDVISKNKAKAFEIKKKKVSKFQERRINVLEARTNSQADEIKRQRKQIERRIKRHLLDPSGKMT